MSFDPLVVQAIMALVTGGIASFITQLIKKALHLTGPGAVVLTAVVCLVCTGGYFILIAPPFVFLNFIIYAVVVFGEATGYYHLFQPTA